MNANPYRARQAHKRRAKPGNLAALQRLLWRALKTAEAILDEAAEPDMQLRAVHAISQASGQYVRLLEVGELEARIAALEAAQGQGQ